jgi:hypothetical protein
MIISSKKTTNNTANIKLLSGPNFIGFTSADKQFAIYDLEFSFNAKTIISGGNFLYALALYENNDIKEFIADETNILTKQPEPNFVKVIDFSSAITNTSITKAAALKTGFIKKDITRLVKPSKDYPQSPNSNNFTSLLINKNTDNKSTDNKNETQINTSINLDKYLGGYPLPFENIVTQCEYANGNPKVDGIIVANKNPLDYETKVFSYGVQNSKNDDLLEKAIVSFEREETYKISKAKIIIPKSLVVSNQLLAIIPAKSYTETGELEFKPIFLTQFNPSEIPDFCSVPSFVQPIVNINSLNKDTRIVNLQLINKNPYATSVSINKVFYDAGNSSGLLNYAEVDNLQLDSFESKDILVGFNSNELEPVLFFSYLAGNSVVGTASKRIKGISKKSGLKNKTKLFTFNSDDNQSVEVQVMLPSYLNSLDITIRKKVLAIDGTIIRDFYQVDDAKITRTPERLIFIDSDVKHDQIYEYISYCLKSNCFVSKSSFVFYRNITFNSAEVASMQIKKSAENSFIAEIQFSTTRLEQVLTSLKEATSGQISTDNGNIQIGNFIDNIKTNRDKLADLFKVNVVRQDFQTGQESDLGNFSAGEIIISDALLKAKNVEREQGEARYIFRLLQRSAITLFNEIREKVTDPETLIEFDANLAKFLNPLSLISNILPSESRLKAVGRNNGSKIMINDQFYEGFTGKVVSLVTNKAAGSSPNSSLRLEILDNNKKYQMIKMSGNISREHLGYLFSVEYFGTKTPIFYIPPTLVGYNFVDILTSKLSGPRRYVIESIGRDLVKNVLLVSDVVERN